VGLRVGLPAEADFPAAVPTAAVLHINVQPIYTSTAAIYSFNNEPSSSFPLLTAAAIVARCSPASLLIFGRHRPYPAPWLNCNPSGTTSA
jgi:hypothetical protein